MTSSIREVAKEETCIQGTVIDGSCSSIVDKPMTLPCPRKGTILTPILRSRCVNIRGTIALMVVLSALGDVGAGCGEKKEVQTPPSQPGTASAPGSGTPQNKVTTGADPDKAPNYPNMYGKPAGSR